MSQKKSPKSPKEPIMAHLAPLKSLFVALGLFVGFQQLPPMASAKIVEAVVRPQDVPGAFQFNRNAKVLGGDLFQLTDTTTTWQVGSMVMKHKVDFSQPMEMQLKAYYGYNGGKSIADGISIGFHTGKMTDVGGTGAGMGVRGLPNFVGWKIDSYYNGASTDDYKFTTGKEGLSQIVTTDSSGVVKGIMCNKTNECVVGNADFSSLEQETLTFSYAPPTDSMSKGCISYQWGNSNYQADHCFVPIPSVGYVLQLAASTGAGSLVNHQIRWVNMEYSQFIIDEGALTTEYRFTPPTEKVARDLFQWIDVLSITAMGGTEKIVQPYEDGNTIVARVYNIEGEEYALGKALINLNAANKGRQYHFSSTTEQYLDVSTNKHTTSLETAGTSSEPIDGRIKLLASASYDSAMAKYVVNITGTIAPIQFRLDIIFMSVKSAANAASSTTITDITQDGSPVTANGSLDLNRDSYSGNIGGYINISSSDYLAGTVGFTITVPLEMEGYSLSMICTAHMANLKQAKCEPTSETVDNFGSEAKKWSSTLLMASSLANNNYMSAAFTFTVDVNLPAGYYAVTYIIDLTDAPGIIDLSSVREATSGNLTLETSIDGNVGTYVARSKPMATPTGTSANNTLGLLFNIDGFSAGHLQQAWTLTGMDTAKFNMAWRSADGKTSQQNTSGVGSPYAPEWIILYDTIKQYTPSVGSSVKLVYSQEHKAMHTTVTFTPKVTGSLEHQITVQYDEDSVDHGKSVFAGVSLGEMGVNEPIFAKGSISWTAKSDSSFEVLSKAFFPLKGTDFIIDFTYNRSKCTFNSGTLASTTVQSSNKMPICKIVIRIDADQIPAAAHQMIIDVYDRSLVGSYEHTCDVDKGTCITLAPPLEDINPSETIFPPEGARRLLSPSTSTDVLAHSSPSFHDDGYILGSSLNDDDDASMPDSSHTNFELRSVRASRSSGVATSTNSKRYIISNSHGNNDFNATVSIRKSASDRASHTYNFKSCSLSKSDVKSVYYETETYVLREDRVCYVQVMWWGQTYPHTTLNVRYPNIGYNVAFFTYSSRDGETFNGHDGVTTPIQDLDNIHFWHYPNDGAIESVSQFTVFFVDGSYAIYDLTSTVNNCKYTESFSLQMSSGYTGVMTHESIASTGAGGCAFTLNLSMSEGQMTTAAPSTSDMPTIDPSEPELPTLAPSPPGEGANDGSALSGTLSSPAALGFSLISPTFSDGSGDGVSSVYSFSMADGVTHTNDISIYSTFGRTFISMHSTPFKCQAEPDNALLPSNLSMRISKSSSTTNQVLKCVIDAVYESTTVAAAEYQLRGTIDMSKIKENILVHNDTYFGSGYVSTTNSMITSFNLNNLNQSSYVNMTKSIVVGGGMFEFDVSLSSQACIVSAPVEVASYKYTASTNGYVSGDSKCTVSVVFAEIAPVDGTYAVNVTFTTDDPFNAFSGPGANTLTGEHRDYVVARAGNITSYKRQDANTEIIKAYNTNGESNIAVYKVIDTVFGLVEVAATFNGVHCTAIKNENVWFKFDYDAAPNSTICNVVINLGSLNKYAAIEAYVDWDENVLGKVKPASVIPINGELQPPVVKQQSFSVTLSGPPTSDTVTMLLPVHFDQYSGSHITVKTMMTFTPERVFCAYEMVDDKLPGEVSRDGMKVMPITYEFIRNETDVSCNPQVSFSGYPKSVNVPLITSLTTVAALITAAGVAYYLYDKFRYRTFDATFMAGVAGEDESESLEENIIHDDLDFE